LKSLSPILVKLTNIAVYHTDAQLPIGAERAPRDSWFHPQGESFWVGEFRDRAGTSYLLPVNHGVDQAHELTLRFDDREIGVEVMDRKTGRWRSLPLEKGEAGCGASLVLKMQAGDGELLRIQGR
jgi:hypothetical protein